MRLIVPSRKPQKVTTPQPLRFSLSRSSFLTQKNQKASANKNINKAQNHAAPLVRPPAPFECSFSLRLLELCLWLGLPQLIVLLAFRLCTPCVFTDFLIVFPLPFLILAAVLLTDLM
jgi:hypothetical protein